jgi:hypothetical protein
MRRHHFAELARACAPSTRPSAEALEIRRLFAGVVISEFSASNVNGITDVDGARSDWIEIFNPTAGTVSLDGWSLTDDASSTAKWVFPNSDPNATEVPLPAGGRMVVFASSKDRRIPGQEFHTNFALGKSGEYLGLYPPGSTTPQFDYAPSFPAQLDDVSYGVLDNDPTKQSFFNPPTPGAANTTATGVVEGAEFSVDRGFYNSPFQLAITTATPDASIRYTTDGSPPSPTTGTLYAGPINITGTTVVRAIAYKAGLTPASVDTQTYLFLSQVIQQPKHVTGWPEPAIPIDNISTNTRVHDYEMDPDVVNNPAYSADLLKGLTDIPTMSLVVRQSDMWDPATGQGGFYRLDDVEKPISVEILYPSDPSKNLQVDAGVEGQSHDRLKRSLRLKFKSEFGAPHLTSTLFKEAVNEGSSATDTFDSIILRAGNNRAWSRSDNADHTTFTEDQFFRDSQIAMSGIGSHGNFVHLYINGLYWGLYNPSERPDDNFAAEYLGGEDSDYSSIKEDGPKDGDPARWNYLRTTLKDKDMSVLSNYNELKQYLDVTNFSDYLLLEWYIGNTDWPANNFWEANRNTPTPEPGKFFAWDGEWGLGVSGKGSPPTAWVHPDFRRTVGKNGALDLPNLFNSAKASPEFKILLADRAYKAAANGGALTDAAALNRFDKLNAYIQDAVVAESARWGDTVDPNAPKTRDVHWQNEVNFIRNYIQGNAADLISALRGEGYYPSNNPATFSQRGGTVAAGFKLTLTNPNSGGTIYYTLDGSDPRAVGGGIAGTAYSAANGITLNQNGTVRVRVRSSSGEWSASDQVAFTVTGQPPGGSQATVRAVADATVRNGSFAAQNFGTATTLEDKTNASAGYTRWSYLRFDIASFSSITGATLRLFGRSSSGTQNVTVNVLGSTSTAWSETGITWNNKPASSGSSLGSKTIAGTATQLYTFDVGAYVAQQRAAGATAVTFVVKANTTADALATFNSDEAAGSRPELLVTYNGSNPSVPTTLRSTADAFVRDGGSGGLNFGSIGNLELKKEVAGYNREIWLKFDLTNVASIGAGKLRMYGRIDSATQSPQVSVYSSSGTSWTETGLTFNNRPTAGTTALATVTVATSTSKYYEWDVTNYIKAEKAAGRNLVTLVLRSLSVTTPQLIFNSDEAASNPPQLQITG